MRHHDEGHKAENYAADERLHIGAGDGAGDGNRTRTISLGIRQIRVPDRPELGSRCTASDRHRPCDTGVNGPPMARRLTSGCGWPTAEGWRTPPPTWARPDRPGLS